MLLPALNHACSSVINVSACGFSLFRMTFNITLLGWLIRLMVSSCSCCMIVSCVHPVAVLNAAFCMACSLLMLDEDTRGDYMEEAYSRADLMTAL